MPTKSKSLAACITMRNVIGVSTVDVNRVVKQIERTKHTKIVRYRRVGEPTQYKLYNTFAKVKVKISEEQALEIINKAYLASYHDPIFGGITTFEKCPF